jgi:hypothetical protein
VPVWWLHFLNEFKYMDEFYSLWSHSTNTNIWKIRTICVTDLKFEFGAHLGNYWRWLDICMALNNNKLTEKGLLQNCFCEVIKLMCAAPIVLFFYFWIWLSNRKLGLPALTFLFTDPKTQAARGVGEVTGFPGVRGEPYYVAGSCVHFVHSHLALLLIDRENWAEPNR